MTIDVYCFEDAEGNEFGSFNTQNYAEAQQFARDNKLRIICRHFEYTDSESLDDYTHGAEAAETVDEWRERYDELDATHAFVALATNWHSGQWSAFYLLQCVGAINDAEVASRVAAEARANLATIDPDHGDYDAMKALMEIADEFPNEEEADDDGD